MTRLKSMMQVLKDFDGEHHRYNQGRRSVKRQAKMLCRLADMRYRTRNRIGNALLNGK
jgi:hypothetical protein